MFFLLLFFARGFRAAVEHGSNLRLLKKNTCFPLLVSKGIYDYWKYDFSQGT